MASLFVTKSLEFRCLGHTNLKIYSPQSRSRSYNTMCIISVINKDGQGVKPSSQRNFASNPLRSTVWIPSHHSLRIRRNPDYYKMRRNHYET